eukprot:scaffold15682_cov131-Isochrysis_galbana.AAC.9
MVSGRRPLRHKTRSTVPSTPTKKPTPTQGPKGSEGVTGQPLRATPPPPPPSKDIPHRPAAPLGPPPNPETRRGQQPSRCRVIPLLASWYTD